ncbi:nmrA-like family domain-containing protein 1 [Bombina bombina]|uniref:nmrA-like family domain-containing protein 1 n=1 Tax=Bombina bombina TaxID=8345 RepID=UPI00235B23F6|nr:nmrA-like family domain-containing protein 1 [Bombina bombina]
MSCKKIIAVFGATGAQGGSVVEALLKNPNYLVRAVTRDVKRPAAVTLQKKGAEVVKGDLNNLEDVSNILTGAYGAFVVTNFWDNFSKETEVTQGKMVADLAKKLQVKHVVYSGLEDVKKLTGGKLEVLHFDGKGEVEEYFWKIGVPMTSVRMAFYFENFLTMMKPIKAADGQSYNLALPMEDIPMDGMSVADIGPVVASLFCGPDHYIGKAIGLSAERLTAQQYAEKFSKHLGKTVNVKKSMEEYEKNAFPGIQEMANMFRFYWMKPDRDIELTHKLNPNVRSFDQFLTENKEALKNI